MIEKSQLLPSEKETEQLAQQLALKIQEVFSSHQHLSLRISLEGDLGAGKTTFARYLLKALGHIGKVKSPTYALCEPYEITLSQLGAHSEPIKLQIHHFDLYRMNTPEEWIEAGFRDTLSSPGLCLIEWAEKAEGSLPPFDLTIHLQMNSDETRQIEFSSHTLIGQQLLA